MPSCKFCYGGTRRSKISTYLGLQERKSLNNLLSVHLLNTEKRLILSRIQDTIQYSEQKGAKTKGGALDCALLYNFTASSTPINSHKANLM